MGEKILVTRPSIPPYEEFAEEIKGIWDRDWLTNFGPEHEKLRSGLKEFLGAEELCLTVNGHMALYTAIHTMLSENDPLSNGEIITTPFTFASTTNAIAQNGFEPVFCDTDPVTYTMDADKIEPLITERTRAILPVHVYGTICDTEKIEKIGKKYNIPVIYDAAHAFGVTVSGKGAAAFGDCSCFSFHATKAFNSIEGGAVAVKDANIAEKMRKFTNFGLEDAENVKCAGTNAKMNEFSAAMGVCNLRHIGDVLKERKRVAERYINNLASDAFDEKTGMDKATGLKFLPKQENTVPNYAYFPVLFSVKDGCRVSTSAVKAALEKNDIMTRRYFHPLTSSFECFRNMRGAGETPEAEYISENILALPMYAGLSDDDVDRISGIIKSLI